MILILKLVILYTIGQSLYFKFSGHPQSKKLFSKINLEPTGRVVVGIAETVALILLFIPSLTFIGSILIALLMIGAVLTHLFWISIKFDGDYLLFIYAIVTLVSSMLILVSKQIDSFLL